MVEHIIAEGIVNLQKSHSATSKCPVPNPTLQPNFIFTIRPIVAPMRPSFVNLTCDDCPCTCPSFPTFTRVDFPSIRRTVRIDLDAIKLPKNARCSCFLAGRRECKKRDHWVMELGPNSVYRNDENGKRIEGEASAYEGSRRGNGKKVFVGRGLTFREEWVWCVEPYTTAGSLDVVKRG